MMICSYLLHRGLKHSAEEALDYYAKTRTSNAKVSSPYNITPLSSVCPLVHKMYVK